MFKFAVGSALLVTATQCVAVSLGGTQGSVIIGRPLDILVHSSIDADDAASGLCLEAEVMYGDAKVPASAVTAAIHRVGADGKGALRVRVTEPVNEPIVTLMLKAGCEQNFRRSYTFLADFEPVPVPSSDNAAQTPAVAASQPVRSAERPAARPVAPTKSPVAGAVPPEPEPLGPETPIRLALPAPRPAGVLALRAKARPVAAAGSDAAKGVAAAGAATAKSAEPASGDRLKLDPVDLTADPKGAVLQSGSGPAPASQPTETAPVGDVAVAAPTPAPAPDETAVQKEIQTLREEQERMRLALESVNAQLAQARQDQFSNPVVYGLGALAVLMLGGLLWALQSRRRQADPVDPAMAPWWTVSTAPVPGPDTVLPDAPVESSAAPQAVVAQPAASDLDDMEGLEVEEAGASRFEEVPVAQVSIGLLMDLWQQVDFFESIGQHADAARALESFVRDHPRASEAPYLRWMQLAAHVDEPGMPARAKSLYEHHFQRLTPGHVTSAGVGLSLEDDGAFVQELTQAWPGMQAAELIDAALISQPGDAVAPLHVRTVQAFDDLLSLRALWDAVQVQPDVALPSVAPAAATATVPFHVSGWATLDQVDGPASATPASAASPSENADKKPDLAPLDFDFLKFDKPAKSDGKGDGESR